jgi:hypothetical protein
MTDMKPNGVVAASDEQQPSVEDALKSVLGGLLARADAERQSEEPYKLLFASFKDGGLARAIFDAERAMKAVAMNLDAVVRAQTGKGLDNELFPVVMGLPLAMWLVRRDIEKLEGSFCCADKTRLLLKTFFYEKLGLDIEATPFEMPADRAKAAGQ